MSKNWDMRQLQGRFTNLTRVMTGVATKVKVSTTAATSSTNMTDVTIRFTTDIAGEPLTPGMTMVAGKKSVGHEAGHLKYSSKKGMDEAFSRGNLFATLVNCIEDGRIEKLMAEEYPGFKKWCGLMYKRYWEVGEKTQLFKEERHASIMAICLWAVTGKVFPNLPTRAQTTLKAAAPYIDIGVCLSSHLEVIKVVEEMLEEPDVAWLLEEPVEPPEMHKASSKPQKKAARDQSRSEKGKKELDKREKERAEKGKPSEGSDEADNCGEAGDNEGESEGSGASSEASEDSGIKAGGNPKDSGCDSSKDDKSSSDLESDKGEESEGSEENTPSDADEPESGENPKGRNSTVSDDGDIEPSDDKNTSGADKENDAEGPEADDSGSGGDAGGAETEESADSKTEEGDEVPVSKEEPESESEKEKPESAAEGSENGDTSDGEFSASHDGDIEPFDSEESGGKEYEPSGIGAGSSDVLDDSYINEEAEFDNFGTDDELDTELSLAEAEAEDYYWDDDVPREPLLSPFEKKVVHEKPHPRPDGRAPFNGLEPIVNELTKTLEPLFVPRNTAYRPRQYRGNIDPGSLHRVVTMQDPDIFRRQNRPGVRKDLAVSVALDASGSMRGMAGNGRKWVCAGDACYCLTKTMQNLQVPIKVTGYSTSKERGRKEVPLHFDLIDWGDNNPDNLLNYRPGNNNDDATAFLVIGRELLNRPEKEKLMIILSDGEPACDRCDYFQGIEETTKAVLQIQRNGIKVVSLYFGPLGSIDDALKIYGPQLGIVNDVTELPRILVDRVKRLLIS